MKQLKHLDTFKVFEELKISTYNSAADKLSLRGHDKRARELKDHAKQVVVKGGNFEYYNAKHNTKVVNPKYVTNTISEMEVIKNEIDGPDVDTASFSFVVRFQKPADVFTIDLSDPNAKCEDCIKFKERKDARRFTAMCNKYIEDNIEPGASYTKLNINDFYTE